MSLLVRVVDRSSDILLSALYNKGYSPDCSDGCVTLCHQEKQHVNAAVFLPEHLARIAGTHCNTSLQYEINNIYERDVTHQPTLMLHFSKARIWNGLVILNNRQYMKRLRAGRSCGTAGVQLENVALTDSLLGSEYFGHWLRDDLSTALAAENKFRSIRLFKPSYRHAGGYWSLSGLSTDYVKTGNIHGLNLYVDTSENSYRVSRYLEMRKRIAATLMPVRRSNVGVFLKRGASGQARLLVNEDKLITHFIEKGFSIIEPEKMTVEEIVRSIWDAPIVIAVEGSNINHALYTMSLDGLLLVLQPPNRFSNVHKNVCDAIGRKYGFYVCEAGNKKNNFYVDSFNDLDALITMAENS